MLLALVPVAASALEVVEARREEVGDRVRVQVTGTIEAPFPVVREVLLDLEGFDRWFPQLAAWTVLARGPRSAQVHGRQDAPWPIADRDYVVTYRWREAQGPAFVLEALGEPDAEPAAEPGVVRIEDLRSEWHVQALAGGQTRASYVYEGGVGRLPDWVDRIAWRQRTVAVIEALAAEVARRAGGVPGGPH